MKFLTEAEPERGVAMAVLPGIRRLTAANSGPMTYHGTNTYLVDWDGGVAVLDPGPDDPAHVGHIVEAAGAPIRAILLTHGHHDHWGGLAGLRAATGAPVYGFRQPAAPEVQPDVRLDDGDVVGGWRAVHSPGHAPDHLCFLGPAGVLFSGDHVMGWSSTVVGGPQGDMAAYFGSLQRLLDFDATVYLPGHGPPVPEPKPYAEALLAHRRGRESAILHALGPAPVGTSELVGKLYIGLDPALHRAAERNVLAHLGKLVAEGRAAPSAQGWVSSD